MPRLGKHEKSSDIIEKSCIITNLSAFGVLCYVRQTILSIKIWVFRTDNYGFWIKFCHIKIDENFD
jgi:hypothetical protein